jgi:hypothetical protein
MGSKRRGRSANACSVPTGRRRKLSGRCFRIDVVCFLSVHVGGNFRATSQRFGLGQVEVSSLSLKGRGKWMGCIYIAATVFCVNRWGSICIQLRPRNNCGRVVRPCTREIDLVLGQTRLVSLYTIPPPE